MPYINIKVAGNLSAEDKRTISKEVSETMFKVTGKPKESCYIVFDEISRENWAKGENILADLDKQKSV